MDYLHFFSSFTDTLVAFAAGGGYVALFIILLLEGLPLIGVAIPGHVAVISAGFLVSIGTLNFFWVFMIALSGAVLGDYVSFILGRKYGWPLIEHLRPFFFISESVIAKARAFLDAHTGKALFFGRFNPVTRGLMPFFVGANRMSPKPFWIWNTIGAVVWVFGSVVLGYALGLGYNVVSGWTSRALVVAIILAVLIVWSYRFVNVRFHIFRRYELFVLGLNLASLLIFFRMVEDAFSAQPFMAAFDLYVNALVNDLIAMDFGGSLIRVASWVSALGGTIMMAILTITGGIVLAANKKWRSAIVLLFSMGSTVLLVGWIKDIILRIRPENLIAMEDPPAVIGFLFDRASTFIDPSFPSGHAAFAAAFFVIVAYLAVPRIKSWVKRELFIVLSVILTLVIGISRVLVSAHWASDVIAGWALGIFCAATSILFVRYVGTLVAGKIQ